VKHYLLTWYGMTDLRAALGVEESDGPVLSALKTGDYTDVVILAYTNPDKGQRAFDGALRDEWEEWFTAPPGDQPPLSRDRARELVDAAANTEAGHEIFLQWLNGRLDALDLQISIQVLPQRLKRLNDASGIYSAATAAVRVALEEPDDKRVTTYVSPGTPVMAYTWALIARSNPSLKIGVISSSDPRKPPERIELPKALLDTSISDATGQPPGPPRYDLVIHLLGEQTIPVFFGLRQFRAERHVIVSTKQYEASARRLAKAPGIEPNPVVIASPFKPADTRRAITKQVGKCPPDAKIAVNMTGGTKLMFAGALSACWELGLDPFYFEIEHHDVIFLRDGSHVPFVGISNVEDFLRAGDFATASAGRWDPAREKRLPAAREMWRRRDALRGLYKTQKFLAFANQWDSDRGAEFSFSWSGSEASLDAGAARLVLKGADIEVSARGYFRFLRGEWLEDHVYSLLRPLADEGTIRDVRIGFKVGYREDSASKKAEEAQEFDAVFTDGKRLWIVECKAGPVKQEAIQKLANNVRLYGGVAGRGILVSSFGLTEPNTKRLKTFPALRAIPGTELSTDALRAIVLGA
jgi:Domain of unknown function (DUF1887)